jgi:uncharacterized protein (DUF2235 family)
MKRLIVCCDGTWQKLKSEYPTNVVKIAQGILPSSRKDGIAQIVFYDEGVGTDIVDDDSIFSWVNTVLRVIGGAFGSGINNDIQEAYRFLSLNYEPGDEIYLFGFSRGSFTVRSLAGLINCSGGLLSLPLIREIPFAYDLYKDTTLTFKEKEKLRKLPIPFKYLENADIIKKCREEAFNIYRDRKNLSFEEAEMDTPEAKKDLKEKETRVQEVLQKYDNLCTERDKKLSKREPELGLKYEHEKSSERKDEDIRQPAKVTLLGCWDTVGSLGLPPGIPVLSDWVNKNVKFHDTTLSPIIQHALHAVSIDEKRKVFDVTLMKKNPNSEAQTLSEVWFPGTHGCVGGGTFADRMLSNLALTWMEDEISNLSLGLDIDLEKSEDSFDFDKKYIFDNDPKLFGLWGLFGLAVKEREIPVNQFTKISESAETRLIDDSLNPRYEPTNLVEYKKELEKLAQKCKDKQIQVVLSP